MIEHGHTRSEIDNMTIGEVQGFSKAVKKKEIEDQINFISGVMLGSQASGKDVKKAIKDLEQIVRKLDGS